jgi:IclR helix-turn-helix domain
MIARASMFCGAAARRAARDGVINAICGQLSAFARIIAMSDPKQQPITITLSPAQVDQVVRAANESRVPSITATLSAARADSPHGGYALGDTDDPRLSRSLVRGLSLLTCFGPDGEARGIIELAADLGMSASTAHRYASTLVELGLLERSPRTRKYRPAGLD